MFKTSKIQIAFLIFLLSLHTFVYPTSKTSGNYKIKTIVLDAGHGGHDTGCNGPSGSFEKTVTLKVILALGKIIEEKYPDIKVLYSRKTDEFITLQDRALLANKNNADLFLSVHCNANSNKAAFGTETFLMGLHVSQANLDVAKRENAVIKLEDNYEKNYDGFDPDSPESAIALSLAQNANIEQSSLLAAKVQNQLTNNLKRFNRGVKQAGFWVLYRTTCPSILIETGFLTNATEEKFLTSPEGQDDLANSIFHAFEDYKNTIEKGTSSINPPTIINEDSNPTTTTTTTIPVKTTTATAPKNNSTNDDDNAANTKPIKGIVYKVQIKADNAIPPKADKSYKLFKDIKFEKVKNVVKYVCGPYNTYTDALKTSKKAKASGYKDAFVVVYKNGERLTFDEAKKYFK